MSNFNNLNQYILPADLLLDMLNIYQYLGKNSIYDISLKKNQELIEQQTLERDAFFLSVFLKLKISDNRLRLLITKNSNPRTSEERIVTNLKIILAGIRKSAPNYSFNSSDLLSMINNIYGRNYAKFSQTLVSGDRKKNIPNRSIRNIFDNMLDEYTFYFEKRKYEKIFLSLMAYVEMTNLNPFTEGNNIASLLALYYMMIRCNVECFRYISFFEALFNHQKEFENERISASLNYQEGYIQVFNLARLTYQIIDESYQKLEAIIKEYSYEERVNKSDNVENTIYKLPNVFTKDDIRLIHPFVSEATINRILVKLRDQEYIIPLGKGRSAKWMKTNKEEIDYKNIF